MGCSASRPDTHFTIPTEEPSSSSSCSHPSSHFSYSSPLSSKKPVSRTISLPTPLVHHPPLRKGDTNHLVSLTSTTYGSLVHINRVTNPNPNFNGQDHFNHSPSSSPSLSPSSSPNKDPIEFSSPDSVINTWELMDGLDDYDVDFHCQTKPRSLIHDRSIESPKKPNLYMNLDCDGSVMEKLLDSYEIVKSSDIVEELSVSKPLWKHLSEESMLAKMDPNVVSSYRRALSSRQLGFKNQPEKIKSFESSPMIVSQPRTLGSFGFSSPMNCSQPKTVESLGLSTSPMNCSQPKTVESLGLSTSPANISLPKNSLCLSGTEDRIVLYFTSLRGIRKTYEDCCMVRMIFRGFRVAVDERDISMDSAYRKELQNVLGGKAMSLPQVFIRGKHVGGADEVKQIHEIGELGKLLEGFQVQELGFGCKNCGDARFMPCQNCNGSRKVFEEEEGRLRKCPDCNENGLIRCPICCS